MTTPSLDSRIQQYWAAKLELENSRQAILLEIARLGHYKVGDVLTIPGYVTPKDGPQLHAIDHHGKQARVEAVTGKFSMNRVEVQYHVRLLKKDGSLSALYADVYEFLELPE